MELKNNKPYPKVMVERPNLEYASILLESYAGEISEDTAIHLYLYQSLISEECKDILLKISEVEMHHLYLLGETIALLGIKPIYGIINQDKIIRLWNAGNVNYNTSLKEILEIDINAEKQAINNYQCYLKIIKDKYIIKLIERIIEDEEIHLKIFKQLYNKYFGNQ